MLQGVSVEDARVWYDSEYTLPITPNVLRTYAPHTQRLGNGSRFYLLPHFQ